MLTSFCPGASSIMSKDSNGAETTQILKPFFFRLPTILEAGTRGHTDHQQEVLNHDYEP